MNKPTAIIDKSLLQAICEQDPGDLNYCINTLRIRFQVVVPSILVEEVWVNLANPGSKIQGTLNSMVECLIQMQDSWIGEPLDIAFLELVKGETIEILPPPPAYVMNSFWTLRTDDAKLKKWAEERKQQRKAIIRSRVREQAGILNVNSYASIRNERDFFEQVIRNKFTETVADSNRKKKLLEGILGQAFRFRHPELAKRIDAAFESYSLDTFEKYPATLYCILTAMFYFYAPLCQIVESTGAKPRKNLGRGTGDQLGNLADEKYIQSALLCSRLLTCDEGMANVMKLFKASGLWHGETVFIKPQDHLVSQIKVRFA